MNCDDIEELIGPYCDGELPADQRQRVEDHLAGCETCRAELANLQALEEKLAMIEFAEPTDAGLELYWRGVYNRLERGVGWILLSIGAIIVLCYGGFKLIEEIVRDPSIALVFKFGFIALVFGAVILFVSLLRERLAVRKADRYSREIKR